MRAQRLESMKQEHKKRQEWLANGNQKIHFSFNFNICI